MLLPEGRSGREENFLRASFFIVGSAIVFRHGFLLFFTEKASYLCAGSFT